VQTLHFDKEIPQVFKNQLTFTSISDASSYFHWVDAEAYETWEITRDDYLPSPGDQSGYDPATYHILEFQLKLNSDKFLFSRSSYQILNLIGDSGGIDTAVFWLGGLITSAIAGFYL